MQQHLIDDLFIESLISSKNKEEKINNTMGYLLFSSVNFACNVGKTLFHKYVEEPRQQLQLLTIQNDILIRNQNEFLNLMRKYNKNYK